MNPQQFTFTQRQKAVLGGAMAIGLVSALICFFFPAAADKHHAQFWTNMLHDTYFFLGISFISLYLYVCHTQAYAGWHTAFKRVWEAMFMYLPWGAGIMLVFIVLGTQGLFGFHHLYEWAIPGITEHDAVLAHKSGMLNKTTFLITVTAILGTWIFWAFQIRKRSLQEDKEGGLTMFNQLKVWTAAFMPIGAFSSPFLIWFLMMSIDPHWYSTMFAWYSSASFLVSAVAFTLALLLYLRSQGYFPELNPSHFHDLGKYLFGFSVFWTYLWFDQFMLIWYANVGEETTYFKFRYDEFWPIFAINLILNFALPFLVLIRNTAKTRVGILAFMAGLIFFGHWIDFYQQVKPGILKQIIEENGEKAAGHVAGAAEAAAKGAEEASTFISGFQVPGLLEIGMFLGFLGLFVWIVFSGLTKASLSPVNDPYLAESLHYSTGIEDVMDVKM